MLEKIIDLAKDKLKGYLNYLILFIAILLIVSLVRNILRINRAGQEVSEAEERVERMKKENEELKARVESLKSEEYKEAQLRDKLGLTKEGEIILVLPDEETLRKLAPNRPEEEDTLPDPNWKKWFSLFR